MWKPIKESKPVTAYQQKRWDRTQFLYQMKLICFWSHSNCLNTGIILTLTESSQLSLNYTSINNEPEDSLKQLFQTLGCK